MARFKALLWVGQHTCAATGTPWDSPGLPSPVTLHSRVRGFSACFCFFLYLYKIDVHFLLTLKQLPTFSLHVRLNEKPGMCLELYPGLCSDVETTAWKLASYVITQSSVYEVYCAVDVLSVQSLWRNKLPLCFVLGERVFCCYKWPIKITVPEFGTLPSWVFFSRFKWW